MKLYIYQINLSRTTAELVLDQEKMHKFLTRLISSDRASANLLYRLDVEHGLLFVQSDIEPSKTEELTLLHIVDVDKLISQIKPGDHITFRLQMIAEFSYSGTTHFVPAKHIGTWLQKKLNRYGLNLEKYQDLQKTHLTYTHSKNRGGRATLTIHDFLITGTVTNMKFFQRWHKGFGNGKNYGAGLAVMTS